MMALDDAYYVVVSNPRKSLDLGGIPRKLKLIHISK